MTLKNKFWHFLIAHHYFNSSNLVISFDYSWFLGKILSNFVSLLWKLQNPYCHNIRSSSSSGSRPDFFEDYVNDEENSLIEEVNFEKTSSKKSKFLRRPKRDANVQMKMEYQEFQSNSELVLSPSPRDQKLIDQLDCGPTKCTHMACTVGPLRKRESVVFRIYSRLDFLITLGIKPRMQYASMKNSHFFTK